MEDGGGRGWQPPPYGGGDGFSSQINPHTPFHWKKNHTYKLLICKVHPSHQLGGSWRQWHHRKAAVAAATMAWGHGGSSLRIPASNNLTAPLGSTRQVIIHVGPTVLSGWRSLPEQKQPHGSERNEKRREERWQWCWNKKTTPEGHPIATTILASCSQ